MRTPARTAAAASKNGGSRRPQAARRGTPATFKPVYLVIPVVLVALAVAAWFWFSRNPSAEVAAAWGLPGTWQRDCDSPVRAENPRYTYSIEGGKLLLRRDFGGEAKDVSTISDVEKISAGELKYTVTFAQLGANRQEEVIRQNVLAKTPDDRIRAIFNKNAATGAESVVKGILATTGQPTPWMSRCKAR